MTKSVLITGGFGYVGSRLTPLLLEKGYSVRVIDLMLYGTDGFDNLKKNPNFKDWESKFTFIEGDIRDPETVKKALNEIDSVVHLAAISNDPTGELDEVLTKQVNFDAVGLLLSIAKEQGIKRFINASSSSVFGIKKEENVTEELEPEPITFYSKYKMLSEWLVRSSSSDNFCTVNIRPATICGYSPRQRFDLTVNKLTADAFHKKKITVHGGQQRRPNVGMTDIINLYAHLLEAPNEKINGKTFNFGFENLKVIEIAELIQTELSDMNPSINVEEVFDQRDYHISSQKILNELNYETVSTIASEVAELRTYLGEVYQDTDQEKFYNIKTMNLKRNNKSYDFLSH